MAQHNSNQTKDEAMTVAKSIKKPGQTKEQTKLVAQGIEKGIAEYKKQQKAKARERDKQRKQEIKAKAATEKDIVADGPSSEANSALLPWLLLSLSWLAFVGYYLFA